MTAAGEAGLSPPYPDTASPRETAPQTDAGTRRETAGPDGPSKAAILRRNALEYDDAADPYWRRTVYEASHGGWWFANVGGRRVLDDAARAAHLGADSRVLELCSGLGDTCRYLGERHGCRVTGVEINRHQVRQARHRLAALAPQLAPGIETQAAPELAPAGAPGAAASGQGPGRAGRVRFEVGDVLRWRPRRRYDLVLAVDALSLLEDRQAALATARRALRPGGLLVVADTLAGPRIDAAVRRHVWREDGLLDLPDPAGHDALLRGSGFRPLARADLTVLGERVFRNMEVASFRHRDELVAAKGTQRWESWLRNARLYRGWFGGGELLYQRVLARRED